MVNRVDAIVADKQLTVARLQYEGNWDPEPGGWLRLGNLMHNQNKVDLTIKPVKLGRESLDDVKVAHLTGTSKFKLDDKQHDAIKKFVAGGGLLMVDAAGGSTGFAESAEAELRRLFPDALQPLADTHAIFGDGGNKIEIEYREYARKILGTLKNASRLQGVEVDGKLVGNAVDGVVGYTPATATELVRRTLISRTEPK